jgi:predicted branched-subunit amino acid permease
VRVESTRAGAAFQAGVRRALPLAVGIFPFGVVYGVAVAQSDVSPWIGGSASVFLFAGASQLSLLELHQGGAAFLVAVGTALVINARFVLYSAALAPAFAEFPAPWRWGLPHLMTDQAATLSLLEFDHDRDPLTRRWFYLGAAAVLFVLWQVGTVLGIVAGTEVPDSLQLGFIIPLMFTALVVPALDRRPAWVAAVVSVAATLLLAWLPPGTNILLGALTGILAGALVERSAGSTGDPQQPPEAGAP